jgi:hypothetical protein
VKKIYLTAVLLLGLGGIAQASSGANRDMAYEDFEQVHRISVLTSLYGWREVDDHAIIVWATPFRPYLIELTRRSPDLRFSNTIGVTSTANTVYDKFDSVIVDGLRYPIKAIYKLDRESARNLKRIS